MIDTSAILDLGTSTLFEAAGGVGALPPSIQSIRPGMKIAGPALPVLSAAGDNLWLHRAVYRAAPGEVLVVAMDGPNDPAAYGHWGEVLTVAAQQRGIGGVVIAGGVRDGDAMAARKFPTFAISECMCGTGKDVTKHGSIGSPIVIQAVSIRHGDLVVGDSDGVLILPSATIGESVEAGMQRQEEELEIIRRLEAGGSTLDEYSLPVGPMR